MDIIAYLKIIRPSGCLLVAATSILGQILVKKNLPDFMLALTVAAVEFIFTAAGFVLNDYFDYKSDSVNSPWRPIPSGRITRANALKYTSLLVLVGIATSLFITPIAALAAILTLLASMFYTVRGKSQGITGNLLVALIISSSLVVGAFTIDVRVDALLIGAFILCFLYVLGGEIAQSIADAEGDRIGGVRSVTLVKGPKTAAILASACFIAVAFIGALGAFFSGIEFSSLTPVLIIVTISMVFIIITPLLVTPDRATALKTRYRINLFAFIILIILFSFVINGNHIS